MTQRLTQRNVNDALTRLLTCGSVANLDPGGVRDLQRVIKAVERGEVTIRTSANRIVIQAVVGHVNGPLAQEMQRLMARPSAPTQANLAADVGLSLSTVIRMLHGQTLSSWPNTKAIVDRLGGDAVKARALWDAERAKQVRKGFAT